jgi:hypothetical protein
MIRRILNKRADIAVTILVLGILALMIFALLGFYLAGEKIESGGINSAFYLQAVYNTVESARFSGLGGSASKYGIDSGQEGYVLDVIIPGKIGGLWGIGGKDIEALRIKYEFDEYGKI